MLTKTRARARLGGLLALLCAVALPSDALGAGNIKPYTLDIAPSTLAAGQPTTLTATYTNRTTTQQLGSSNLTAPEGYTVASASTSAPGQASVSGRTVQLRNLSLPPGASLTVTMRVVPPCAPGTARWSAVTKQANDFKGPPGNDLTLDAARSSTSTTTVGSCHLRFVTQPADAGGGQALTDTAYTPAPGGAPIRIELLDGLDNRISSTAAVTVATAPATLLSGTLTVPMNDGVATFSDLSISAPGDYRLVASSPGSEPATSDEFRVDQFGATCEEDIDCSGTVENADTRMEVTALGDAGATDATVLTVSFEARAIDCPGYTERMPDSVRIDAPGRIKLATATLRPGIAGTDMLQSCLEAPYQFTPRPLTPLTAEDTDGDGTPDQWRGLLPDCLEVTTGLVFPPPCVDARGTNPDGSRWIRTKLPAPDPLVRH